MTLEQAIADAVDAAIDRRFGELIEALDRPLVLTLSQTADALQVSTKTVSRWVDEGLLPRLPHTVGKVLIPRAAVEAMVAGERP